MSTFIESLESRRLLSAVPHKADSVIIAEDKAAIATAKAQIPVDNALGKAKLAQDKLGIATARATLKGTLAAEKVQLKLDHGDSAKVAVDHAAISDAKANYHLALAQVHAQIAADKAALKATLANDRAALKAAKLKLHDDRKAHL